MYKVQHNKRHSSVEINVSFLFLIHAPFNAKHYTCITGIYRAIQLRLASSFTTIRYFRN